jgi:hypothetical protein
LPCISSFISSSLSMSECSRSQRGSEAARPGKGACQLLTHTHLVRGGSVMLRPTLDDLQTEDARSSAHTDLVRGASVMLQPGCARRVVLPVRLASATRTGRSVWRALVGSIISNPPLTRLCENSPVRSPAFRRKFVIRLNLRYKLPPEGRTTNFSHSLSRGGYEQEL